MKMKSIMEKALTGVCFSMIKLVCVIMDGIGVFTMLNANRGIYDWKILLSGIGLIALGVIGNHISDKVYDKM